MRAKRVDIVFAILFVLAVFGFGIWYGIYRWNECREFGHTRLYCIGHVIR